MKNEIYPKNKEHFKKLIPFAQEIILLCKDNGIDPVVYGSFAHFYHTKDKSMNVDDIDLIISEKDFPIILKILREEGSMKIILDGNTIVARREDLIIEFDKSKNFEKIIRRIIKIDFYGMPMNTINLEELERIYPIAFNTSYRNKGKVLEKIISLEKFLGRKLKGFNMKNKEVCSEIYKVFSKEPEVLAIFNNGSSVMGQDDEGSDIDFVIVVRKIDDKNKIRELFRKKYKILKNEEDPKIAVEEQYSVLGKRVDPTIITKKEIEEKVYRFYLSIDNYLNYQHFLKHKIIDSVALFDMERLLPKWKKEIEKYPKGIIKDVFDSQIVSIKENLFYWRYHKFRNEFQFGFEQWDVIKAICQALYAKNRRLFMLPYKRLHKDLKELRPNLEKEMYELIRGINTPKIIKKKIKIVKVILSKLKK